MDTLTPAERSARMSLVRSRDTKPELTLRLALRAAGLAGYRVHRRDLKGCPDLAYGRWRVAVFVDGAWWHGRSDRWRPEKANEIWRAKIGRNIARDCEVDAALAEAGWTVVRLWDDEVLRDPAAAAEKVRRVLFERGRS